MGGAGGYDGGMRGATKSGTGHRLMVYLSGVAIGFVILGIFSGRRAQEAAYREAAARESAARQHTSEGASDEAARPE